MRIIFLTPWYPSESKPNHGIFVRDQAKAVATQHTVTLIAATIDYNSPIRFFSFSKVQSEFEGVTEFRIVIKRSFPVFNQLNFFLTLFWQTFKIAREFKPDIIHGNIGYPGAFWSWIISKAIGKPFVVTEHSSRFTNNFRSRIHKFLTINFLAKASRVISVSNQSAKEVASFIGVTPQVIPNIIDFTKFTTISIVDQNKSSQFGFLGGLNTVTKGLDILLKAIVGIQSEFVLHIGGSGELLDEYKALAVQLGIEEKCIFHGFVPHWQVPEFMSRLHFFVSASRYESFGMVMVEAMACGLPVVATQTGGPIDFMKDEVGMLIPCEDETSLRDALVKMLKTHHGYNREYIRDYAFQNFSQERFREQIQTVYNEVIT